MDTSKQNLAEQLLAKAREQLTAEGISLKSGVGDEADLMKDYVIKSINATKDVQKNLYHDFLPKGASWQRRVKNKVIAKLANISRNTVERSFIKQQKFNDNVALLLEYLFQENQKLALKIKELEAKNNGAK